MTNQTESDTTSVENTGRQLDVRITTWLSLVLVFLTLLFFALTAAVMCGDPSFWNVLGRMVSPSSPP